MKIIETSVFTTNISNLLEDTEYRLLQNILVNKPETGSLIKGSGGLRKLRWKLPGRGKRGGISIIYFYRKSDKLILMLLVFQKNRQDDLTKEQLKILGNLAKKELYGR